MEAFDVNRSWKAPDGYDLRGVYAEGAFLRHEYYQPSPIGEFVFNVFVNDMGREVTRTSTFVPSDIIPTWKLLTRWEKIKNAFWNLIDVLFDI